MANGNGLAQHEGRRHGKNGAVTVVALQRQVEGAVGAGVAVLHGRSGLTGRGRVHRVAAASERPLNRALAARLVAEHEGRPRGGKENLGAQGDPEEKGAVKVFSYRTFKGLEFDALFMPDIDGAYFSRETKVRLNQAMVGITRAKERVFLGCKNIQDANSFFLRRLRADQTVFEIRELHDQDVIDYDDDIPF